MLNINVYRTLKSRSRILLPSASVTACLAFNAYIVLNSAILDKQHVLPCPPSPSPCLEMKLPCSVITHLLSVRSTCTRDKMLGGGVLLIACPNARVDLQEVLLVAIYCFVCVWVFYVCYFVFLRRSGQWNLISGWWHNFHASVFLLYSLVTISPGVNQMIELWMYYKRRTTYNSLVAPQKLAAAVSYRR